VSRPGRRVLALALAVATVVATGLVLAKPATAIAGLQRISKSFASDSTPFRSGLIDCPEGTRGIGGSIDIVGNTQLRIHAIRPFRARVYFAVTEPEEGVAAAWSFNAVAICAPTTSLPGLQYVTDTQRANVLARGEPVNVQAVARCVGRTGTIGIGAQISALDTDRGVNPTTKVRLNSLKTSGTPRGAGDLAGGSITAAGFEGWVEVTAVAICVSFDQVPNLGWMQTALPFDSTDDKQARVACPTGTTLHGGGFLINWRNPDHAGAHVGITDLEFGADVAVVARESIAGTPVAWSLYAIIICA